MNGQVAAITGAGSGIGRALAIALAERGCDLAIADIDTEGLHGTIAELGTTRVRVVPTQLDVTKRADVFAWSDRVKKAFGTCAMILNNAGIAYGSTAVEGELEHVEHLMNVNFWGVVHGTQAFVPILEEAGGGNVVNISSLFGLVGFPGNAFYCASKFAVRGFTEALRQDLAMAGSKIVVSCVHPGGIKTPIARKARAHESLARIGMTPKDSVAEMEKHLRMPPRRAAEIILRGARAGKARILVGADATLMDVVQRLMPSGFQRILPRFVKREMAR